MDVYTPGEAIGRASQLLNFLSDNSHVPINKAALPKFNAAIATAQVWCEQTASINTCAEVEKWLGTLTNIFLDSLEDDSKIELNLETGYCSMKGINNENDKRRVIALLDCLEVAGNTCHIAIHGHSPRP